MTEKKTIYFVAGLPRSGSTLLMNILGQNPRFYVTPTSGILDILVQTRNAWDKSAAFRSLMRSESEAIKANVMKSILQAYFAHTDRPVCFDKNRSWTEYLEMASALTGPPEDLRILIAVRDLRDIVASFEKLYRKTSALSQIPQEAGDPVTMKTAVGRISVFIDNRQPVGRAFNAVRDAVTRGWRQQMHFVEYGSLTNAPEKTIAGIYEFLGQPNFDHDFDHVHQTTFEDDSVHGFKDLHTIRKKVAPQKPQWPFVFDDTVLKHKIWQDVEGLARFWRGYLKEEGKGLPTDLPPVSNTENEEELRSCLIP
jgi:sulfotransferase